MIILCMFTNIGVFASDDSTNDKMVNIIKDISLHIIENGNASIKRGDCITTIMRVTGVDLNAADRYANAVYDQPVFLDLKYDDPNLGYIIIAKFNGVATGIPRDEYDVIFDFKPEKSITVKECLTFMLRCLTDSELVLWDSIMEDSVKMGLLQENELTYYVADQPLQNNQFYTLLCRMLNKNRYLYWPTEEPLNGYAKSMQVDATKSIKYIDWLAEKF